MKLRDSITKEALSKDYEIWGDLVETYKLIARAREIELAKYGLTREQSHTLHILYDNGGSATLNEIAKASFRRHNSVSDIVRRMEKAGLVVREKKQESRQYKITITEKGRRLFEMMPVNSVEMVFSALSGEQKKHFVEYLGILKEKARNILGIDFKLPFLE